MIKVRLNVNSIDPLEDLTPFDQTLKQNPFTNRIREKHDLTLIMLQGQQLRSMHKLLNFNDYEDFRQKKSESLGNSQKSIQYDVTKYEPIY
ncbi:hypothetical protein BCU17_17465 [Vibrio splendidus]|uniref:Uncharacterized protein n=1 Tax=Vibrio splendidus TaxID=29497 RepID=A0A2N7FE22_VIBSP|nr:hypothetical protein BCU17_17465 [Vibrio splendidus]